MRRSELQREKKTREEEEEKKRRTHNTANWGKPGQLWVCGNAAVFWAVFSFLFSIVGWATDKTKFNWQLKRQLEAKWPFFLVFFGETAI